MSAATAGRYWQCWSSFGLNSRHVAWFWLSRTGSRAHREVIKRLGKRFGLRNIRVFGSVARGEATPDSNLDLLVDVERGHGYFDMAGFALGVEDELGVMTQVATPGGMKLRIRDRVLREAVAR
jgi:predicted nucleotidyltransferase